MTDLLKSLKKFHGFHRWTATVVYRTTNDPVVVEHKLEEIEDLQKWIDFGPHWDTIIEIRIIHVNHSLSETLTLEQAYTI